MIIIMCRCAIGYYCPESTPFGASLEVQCPKLTTTLSGAAALKSCRILDVNVCDKIVRMPLFSPIEVYDLYLIFSRRKLSLEHQCKM